MSPKYLTAALLLALVAPAAATSLSAASMPLNAQKPAEVQKPSDDTLKDRIDYRLETSAVVRKYDVKVKVTTGIAMLSGTVATTVQKTEAERLAKVTGINRVENDVVVDPNVDKTLADHIKAGLSKTGEAISDTWITTKIKWFYLGDSLLKGSDIGVSTSNNVVTLKGTVKTLAGKTHAMELARDTEGVHKVIDEIKVVPGKS